MGDEHRPQLDEIAVLGVLNLHDSPGILATSDLLASDLDEGVGADDGEGNGLAQVLHLVLEVFVFVAKKK